MTTGAAATSRSVSEYTAAAAQNSIMQTKNTKRPSRRPSRRARTTPCAEKVLRFAVGTRVECSVDGLGGWHKGRVVKHWYRESDMPPGLFMPYQIELDREHDRGKLICANHDDDRMIRRAID